MIWLPIPNCAGYEASPAGLIRSLDRVVEYKDGRKHLHLGRILTPGKDRYLRVNIWANNKFSNRWVHRLVAETFLPNPKNFKFVNHINFDRFDNRVENLEWVSAQYNVRHALRAGRGNVKLSPSQVAQIRGSKKLVREIASEFGISVSHASCLRRGEWWQWLD